MGQLFLTYPIWLTDWKSYIVNYKDKSRANMLLSHLDGEAKKQIVGLENDYEKAMEKLDKYSGDTKRLITACTSEIMAQPQVASYNYKELLLLQTCLDNNYTHLKLRKVEHQMSNMYSMDLIMRKLPIQQRIQWSEHLSKDDADTQE